MKVLIICILGLVATSYAGKLNAKREVSEGKGYSSGAPTGAQFNPALAQQSSAPGSFNTGSLAPQPTFQTAQAFSAEQSFQSSEPLNNALPSQASFLPSQQHSEPQLSARRSLDASYQTQLPQQNYLPPNNVERKQETVRAIHTHSAERVAQPVHLERTIYKTISVDRPVLQPYEIVKTVQVPIEKIREIKVPYPVETVRTVNVPYPVEKVREVIREVKVPAPYPVESVRDVVEEIKVPYPVYQDVVKHVPYEKLVPQPYPVVKTLTVDRPVPVLVHHEPQYVHQVAQPQIVQQQQQPIVHQQFLPQQQFVHQPLVQHTELPVASYGWSQPAQIVANAALPQPQWQK